MTEKIAHTRNPREYAGLWFMDKGSGTSIKDFSPNGNDGTASNCSWVSGYYGYGLDFSNSSAKVTVGYPTSLQFGTGPFFISFYFKRNGDPSNTEYLITSRGQGATSGKDAIHIQIMYGDPNTGKVRSFLRTDGGTTTTIIYSNSNLCNNEWHHVYCHRDSSGNQEMWVDGIKQADTDTNTGDMEEPDNYWQFGYQDNYSTEDFEGVLDEVIIGGNTWSQGDITYYNVDLGERASGIMIKDSVTEYCKSFQFTIPDPEANIYNKFQFLDDVRIFFDTTRMVRGRVMDLERPEYEVVVKGLDYTSRLLDRNITGSKTYASIELSTVITNGTDGLVTYFPDLTANNVVTTAFTLSATGITWVEKRIFFAMMELAKIAPDYEFYVDGDLDIHFEPRRTVDSGLTITQDDFWDYNFPRVGKEVYTEIMVYGDPNSSWKAVKVEDSTSMLTWGSSARPFRRSAPPLIDFNLTDEEVAKERVLAMLRRYSNPIEPGFGTVMLEDYKTLRSGDLVKVEISELEIDAYYIVLEAVFQVPDMTLSLKLIENRKGHEEELREMMEKIFTLEVRDIDTSSYVWYQSPNPEISQWEYDWVVKKVTSTGDGFQFGANTYGTFGNNVFGATGVSEEVMDQGTGVL